MEEEGYDGGGGTMDGEQVHYNRDLLKGNYSRGRGHMPLVPPWFRHLWSTPRKRKESYSIILSLLWYVCANTCTLNSTSLEVNCCTQNASIYPQSSGNIIIYLYLCIKFNFNFIDVGEDNVSMSPTMPVSPALPPPPVPGILATGYNYSPIYTCN